MTRWNMAMLILFGKKPWIPILFNHQLQFCKLIKYMGKTIEKQEKGRKNPEQLESWRNILFGHVLKRKDLTSNSRNFLYRGLHCNISSWIFFWVNFFLLSLAVDIIELRIVSCQCQKVEFVQVSRNEWF